MKVSQWEMTKLGEPLTRADREVDLAADEVLVRVAGCGVCHTDIGFLHDGVPTRHELPLVLGHEVSGVVEETGGDQSALLGRSVIVPAVMPCGTCDPCQRGKGGICRQQIFPGNDIHGGFASHVAVPGRQLCVVEDGGDADVGLAGLSVVADAISTPFQAIERSALAPGHVAVFIGVGGVGAFGVQIAAARGATVVAIDVDRARLDLVAEHGADHVFDASDGDLGRLKKAIRSALKAEQKPLVEWRIFETSGTVPGQQAAFQLLVPGAYLSIVGFTAHEAQVPVSRLMAFDATAEGNWGCLPERYGAVLELVRARKVQIAPFIEEHPMSNINHVLDSVHRGLLKRRAVLVPDFEADRA